MKYAVVISLLLMAFLFNSIAQADDGEAEFSKEELSVARFWEDMGPTLRDQGVEAYAIRYHSDFRSWDITGSGGMATRDDAVGYFTKFHEDGHRITCTHVAPVTIDIVGDRAFARLIYEQTNSYADGRVTTRVWRMVDIFQRYENTWQVLENTMVDITPGVAATDETPGAVNYTFHCPTEDD